MTDKYGEPVDPPEREFELDGRCDYCLRVVPASGVCQCGASVAELERARLALQLAKEGL